MRTRTLMILVAALVAVGAGCGSVTGSNPGANPAREVLTVADLGSSWVSDPGTPTGKGKSGCNIDAQLQASHRAQAWLYYNDEFPSIGETLSAYSSTEAATKAFAAAKAHVDSCRPSTETVAGQTFTFGIKPFELDRAYGQQDAAWQLGEIPVSADSPAEDIVMVRKGPEVCLLVFDGRTNYIYNYHLDLTVVINDALKKLK